MSSLPELAALFLWSFLAATVVPVGSEPYLAVLVRSGENITSLFVIATIANYLGACTTYGVARAAASRVTKQPTSRTAIRAARLFRRYGPPALLLSWVPLLGDAVVATAGALAIPFVHFSVWVMLGKSGRYAAFIWLVRAAASGYDKRRRTSRHSGSFRRCGAGECGARGLKSRCVQV